MLAGLFHFMLQFLKLHCDYQVFENFSLLQISSKKISLTILTVFIPLVQSIIDLKVTEKEDQSGLLSDYKLFNYPSIFSTAYLVQGHWEAGAYPNGLWARFAIELVIQSLTGHTDKLSHSS